MEASAAPPEPVRLSFTRSTRASSARTWSVLADTDRLNRLAGLSFTFTAEASGDPLSRGTGAQRHLGLTLRWQERPVEFTAGEGFRIERVYENGPVSRVVNTLQLEPHADGTRLIYEVLLWPRAALLRPLVKADVAATVRPGLFRALEALVRAVDEAADAPDVPPPPLDAAAARSLALRSRTLEDREVAAALVEHLRSAPLTDQTSMAPRVLARRWGLPVPRVVATLLEAEEAGLLVLNWVLACPACRLPAPMPRTVSLRRRALHCASCDLRFDAAITESIALTFQPAPGIRRVVAQMRCLSSPARMPHLVAQRSLAPGAEADWAVDLTPGVYRLCSLPELDVVTLVVGASETRGTQTILVGPRVLGPPTVRLRAGRAHLALRSKHAGVVTLRLERIERDPDRLTLGELLAWPEVAARLPADALEAGVEVAPFEGWVLAVQVARGGRAGEACVGDVLKRARARALQTSTGWVTASFSAADDLATACEALEGASWLGVAVGFGRALELAGQDDRIVAGPLVQDVMGLAARAAPGEVLIWAPERWPASATPAAFHLASTPTPAGDRALSLGEVTGPRLLPPRPAGRPLRPGDVVDERFKLGEILGTGGFGVVFEALDLRTGQEVVVKLLKDERARDDEAAQRFFDEGRLAARLRGRHVARVHEWGLADDGRLFIAMERLTGRELSLVLRSTGLLDPVRTLRMLADALAGLAEAHAEGLVHRDVKPGNLFVVGEGTPDEHVKLIDFGIALDRTGAVVSMDREGVIVGTPAYVSPEQVLGRSLDGRSDLYALALVAHTCLAGAVPFVGETPYELVWARTVVAPESLAQRAPGPLPDGLAALVDATLALEPDARPASAEAMAQRVRGLLSEMGAPESWRAAWAGLCGAADPTERFTRRL